ncbi:MAG: hypothetical protein OXF02_02320 [Simkaniaceae bacterium]|nr:hypothetical protein [Simkaniaceae bacterium]
MTAQLDAMITSKSVPKGSDMDASVSFPKEAVEVVRKTDKVGCGVVDDCRDVSGLFRVLPIGDKVNVVLQATNCFVCVPCAGVAGVGIALRESIGGLVGGSVMAALIAVTSVGGLLYAYREEIRECGCCKTTRWKEESAHHSEEVITEQPKSEPSSPEPVPTASTWWPSFGGVFSGQGEATELAGKSSV